jgi:hypothetical protein
MRRPEDAYRLPLGTVAEYGDSLANVRENGRPNVDNFFLCLITHCSYQAFYRMKRIRPTSGMRKPPLSDSGNKPGRYTKKAFPTIWSAGTVPI